MFACVGCLFDCLCVCAYVCSSVRARVWKYVTGGCHFFSEDEANPCQVTPMSSRRGAYDWNNDEDDYAYYSTQLNDESDSDDNFYSQQRAPPAPKRVCLLWSRLESILSLQMPMFYPLPPSSNSL